MSWCLKECMTFAPATIAPMVNANVKHNPNPNPNLNPYNTLNQKPNHYPHSNSVVGDIFAGAIVTGANVGSPSSQQ